MNLPTSRNATIRGMQANKPVQLTGYPVISPLPYVQNAYEEMRRHGESHNMAEMLAYRSAPASRTDDDFFRGQGMLDQQISDRGGEYFNSVVNGYRQATGGQSPNANHVYMPGLAQFPGDPRAFVASSGEAKRRVEELNVNVSDGFFTHKAREPEQDPFGAMAMKRTKRAPIASDLKNMIKEQMVSKDPGLKGRINDEALEAKHGNHVKVN